MIYTIMQYAIILLVVLGGIGAFIASCRKKEDWVDKVATTTHDPETVARQVDMAVAQMRAEASETQRKIDELNRRDRRW
jgi:Na+-transporting methylmalonyl-CoA/oxaloacetate decarboxylase gamma subunit